MFLLCLYLCRLQTADMARSKGLRDHEQSSNIEVTGSCLLSSDELTHHLPLLLKGQNWCLPSVLDNNREDKSRFPECRDRRESTP